MLIKRLHASFGKLSGDELQLKAGLNIVERPNESGKSTWCSFIRTMLYGIDTTERDKAGFLSDKTRFRPWDGSAMEGSMDITRDGREITIQRKALGKVPMRDFSAVYTGTADPVSGISAENAGQTLTGVSKAVFERTAFIRQSGIRVGQTPELERRISSLVSSGDETTSYTEADAALRAWLRKRRFNRSGTIPALQAHLSEAEEKLAEIEAACEEAASLRIEADRLKKEQTLLAGELRAHEILDVVVERQRIDDAKAAAAEARKKAEEAAGALSAYGSPDEETLNALRNSVSTASAYKEMLAAETVRYEAASVEYEKATELLKASAFAGGDPAAAFETAKAAERAEREATSKKKTLSSMCIGASILLICAAAAAVCGAAGIIPVTQTAVYLLVAVAIVCAAGVAGILFAINSIKNKLAQMLSLSGTNSVDALRAQAESYSALHARAQSAKSALDAAEKAHDEAQARLSGCVSAILDNASKLSGRVSGVEDVAPLLDEIAAKKAELRRLELNAAMAQSIYSALLNAKKGGDETRAAENLPQPRYSRAATVSALDVARGALERAAERYNITLGRMRALGDPIVLSGEINELSAALKEQSEQYGALELAIDALREANSEIQSRFSPILGHAAGVICNRLTGGKYDMLTFDRALEASARVHGDTVSRDVLSLSAGTADQIYLALRLAACAVVLPQDEPCPVILDDALSNFDDERAGLALDYLREMAETRQVILFTCQSREAAHFAGDAAVNIVK